MKNITNKAINNGLSVGGFLQMMILFWHWLGYEPFASWNWIQLLSPTWISIVATILGIILGGIIALLTIIIIFDND